MRLDSLLGWLTYNLYQLLIKLYVLPLIIILKYPYDCGNSPDVLTMMGFWGFGVTRQSHVQYAVENS